MGIVPISLGTQSNPGRYPAAGNCRHINCEAIPAGGEAKSPDPLWSSAGFRDYTTLQGDGGVRALFVVDNVLLAVAGRSVSRVVAGGTSTVVGGLATTGPVYIDRNRRSPNPQVAIVSDGLYSVYEGGVLTAVSDPALPSPQDVSFIDGYFLFTESRGRITRSELDSAAVFDGLAYSNAETNPDKLVRGVRHETTYTAFGERSIEHFVADASVDPFAFSRSAATDIGCASAGSVVAVQQTIIWIADDKTVRRLNGYAGIKISHEPVDRFIESIADLTQVRAFTFTMKGMTYYILTAPEGTWSYNLTLNRWIERTSYGLNRWRISCAVEFDGKIICGDYASPKLYEMRADVFTEAGQPLIMEAWSPPVHGFPYYTLTNAVFIDAISGVGLAETRNPIVTTATSTPTGLLMAILSTTNTTSGGDISNAWLSDPALILDYSDDDGINFKPPRELRLGKAGQTQTRLKALRFGRSKSQGRTYRLRASAATVRGFISMSADITKLQP